MAIDAERPLPTVFRPEVAKVCARHSTTDGLAWGRRVTLYFPHARSVVGGPSSQSDGQYDQRNPVQMQAALKAESGLIVQQFAETTVSRQHQLIGETDTSRKARDRLPYQPLQLRDGIGTVTYHTACAEPRSPANGLKLFQRTLKSFVLASERF
jgi:hypothetical protein